MDYTEEQSNEIEALDSIYCGEMEIVSKKPFYSFTIPIKSEEYEPDSEKGLCCNLKFGYTAKYPDEPPEVEIEYAENFDEGDEELLVEHILSEAQENLGTVMIFTLASSAQEWLNLKWDKIRKDLEDQKLRKIREAEEAEMKRFEGTRVSVDSFLAWKTRFDVEFYGRKSSERDLKDNQKLTGKELFMADKSLVESDLKFLEEGESVKVDETLFQDLEDLELDEDVDDDSS